MEINKLDYCYLVFDIETVFEPRLVGKNLTNISNVEMRDIECHIPTLLVLYGDNIKQI